MVEIDTLIKQGKISRISELEMERYISFLYNSYKENLALAVKILPDFSRWSIIAGYYAMHDITKLLIAKRFRLKIDREVHATTILVLREMVKDKEILQMLELGYMEFLSFSSDLEEAKKARVKAQYYTGTSFMKEEYRKQASEFVENNVLDYIKKMEELVK